MILLHHGSNVFIDLIDLSKSKHGKDFGRGFYLNPDFNQALKWANSRVDFLMNGEAAVSTFEFDIDKAAEEGLKIKTFSGYSEEWAKFVVQNRKNASDVAIHAYDIVIGPIADDSVGYQIREFSNGRITINQLMEEIKYRGGTAIQYLFATEQSLTYLKRKL